MGSLILARASHGIAATQANDVCSANATNADPSGSVQPTGVPAGNYSLVFQDEFNTGTIPDLTKWTRNWLGAAETNTPPVNIQESAGYVPAQATVSAGNLRLAMIATPVTVGGNTYPYRSGCVTTNGKFNFAPTSIGVAEASIYMPGSGGVISNFPAFWWNGQPTWPNNGEFDTVEGLNGVAAAHVHYPGGGPGFTFSGDYTNAFHTFGCVWYLGDKTEYYVDGVKVWTNQPRGSGYLQALTAPKFIICNYAERFTNRTAPFADGPGGPTVVPATMLVDYVRVWNMV